MKTNPDTFPPILMAANIAWNKFAEEHAEFIFDYTQKRQQVLADYAQGKGIITKETHDSRLRELYEDNLPYSMLFAEAWKKVKQAEAFHLPHANKEVIGDVPYWAPMYDDTLPGNPGYEKTKAKIFYPGSILGGAGSNMNSDSAL